MDIFELLIWYNLTPRFLVILLINLVCVFAEGELYVGTVADFSGTDPLIYREPLRTEQYDPKHLNGLLKLIFYAFVFR